MDHIQKVRLAIKTLMSGFPIEVNGTEYRMSEDFDIAITMKQYTIDSNGERTKEVEGHYGTNMSLSGFIKMCDKLDDRDLIGMIAVLTLNNDE